MTDREAEQKYVSYELLCREKGTCCRKLELHCSKVKFKQNIILLVIVAAGARIILSRSQPAAVLSAFELLVEVLGALIARCNHLHCSSAVDCLAAQIGRQRSQQVSCVCRISF